MLTVYIGAQEHFDEEKQEFLQLGGVPVEFEHSLASLSKWESKFEKPFLAKGERNSEEILSYFKCMALDPNLSPEVFSDITQDNIDKLNEYIGSKQTATWFSELPGAPKSSEVITSELIYYWMASFQIPFECQYWHLNRLFTLIKVFNLKNAKPKKMGRAELAARQRKINEDRQKQYNTRG